MQVLFLGVVCICFCISGVYLKMLISEGLECKFVSYASVLRVGGGFELLQRVSGTRILKTANCWKRNSSHIFLYSFVLVFSLSLEDFFIRVLDL